MKIKWSSASTLLKILLHHFLEPTILEKPVFELLNKVPGEAPDIQLAVTTPGGLEPVLVNELTALGGMDVKAGFRIVHAKGPENLLYRSLFELRTAIRVLYPLYRFSFESIDGFYAGFRDFPWEDWFNVRETFALDAVVIQQPAFNNSMFAVQKAKDGIADRFRLRRNVRPSVDPVRPNFRIHVHIHQQSVTVSFDASGHSLHRRGYRVAEGRAPMSEVLASGLIQVSGYQGDREFVDLFCGSGTLLVEAAMLASQTPAGEWAEAPGITRWSQFSEKQWEEVKANARAKIKPIHFPIRGTDVDGMAIATAHEILKFTGFDKWVDIQRGDMRKMQPTRESGVVVSNPPYGERIQTKHDTYLFGDLGRKLKFNFGGWQAWLLLASKTDEQELGLRHFKRIPLMNGNIPVQFIGYSLYRGTTKELKEELNSK